MSCDILRDGQGKHLVEFLTKFTIDGRTFGDSIFATDWQDAERQVEELRTSFRVVGMLEERGATCL